MLKHQRRKTKGFTLVELLIVVSIIGILAAIAIPMLFSAQNRSRYARAAADSKTATTQGIVYSNDKNQNPGNVQILRNAAYANINNTDPWDKNWDYSAAFADMTTSANQGEMGVCSTGPTTAPTDAYCTANFSLGAVGQPTPGQNGSVGYSSIYGSWQGQS